MQAFLTNAVSTHTTGACFGCRTHRGPFVNTKLPDGGLGNIHFCGTCVAIMARAFQMLPAEDRQRLEEKILILEGVVEEIRAARADAEHDEVLAANRVADVLEDRLTVRRKPAAART